MPSWRQRYFTIVLGSDSFLAWTPEVKTSGRRTEHVHIIFDQLLRSQCNEEALMVQFLENITFDDIKQECGPGHEIWTWAASKGSLQAIRKLLDLGIGINISSIKSDHFTFHRPLIGSALFLAANQGHSDIVKYLLRNGAEPNPTIRLPLIGATAGSHTPYDDEDVSRCATCVSCLLKAGADPNSVDDDGRSALSWSTQPAQKSILDLLLNAGADPNIADNKRKLPLHYAAHFSNDNIVLALLGRTANPNSVDENGTSALTRALCNGYPPTIKLLADTVSDINTGGGIYSCPLEAASRYCSSSIVRMILEKGANPNIRGGAYGSCLGALLDRPFNQSVLKDDILCLELLLSYGADPNLRTSKGKQALHTAAEYCYHTRIFEILLVYGSDVMVFINPANSLMSILHH
jgi:ankyrin repeat protein